MIFEEKAPYLDKANKYWYQNTDVIGLYAKENEIDVKNAYIDGLAEGRKEIEELKEDLQTVIDANKKWLQRDTQLEEQIEKMKNMQNCKHNWETKGQCVLNNGGNCICNKWELAE